MNIYSGELLVEAGRKAVIEVIIDEKDLCAIMIRDSPQTKNGPHWKFWIRDDIVWKESLWRVLSDYNKARVRIAPLRGLRVRDLIICPGKNRGGEEMEEGLITLSALEEA